MVLTNKQLNNFWKKVEKTATCWNWLGYTAFGYGKVFLNNDAYPVHRVSLLIAGKDIEIRKKEKGASGVIVMHTCDNRRCVNPQHLKISTQKENIRDAINKGRHFTPNWRGDNNPQSTFMRNNRCLTA